MIVHLTNCKTWNADKVNKIFIYWSEKGATLFPEMNSSDEGTRKINLAIVSHGWLPPLATLLLLSTCVHFMGKWRQGLKIDLGATKQRTVLFNLTQEFYPAQPSLQKKFAKLAFFYNFASFQVHFMGKWRLGFAVFLNFAKEFLPLLWSHREVRVSAWVVGGWGGGVPKPGNSEELSISTLKSIYWQFLRIVSNLRFGKKLINPGI